MSLTSFLDDDRRTEQQVAVVTPRQVAHFRDWLRAEGVRLGIDILPEFDENDRSFEVRVCPLAIASVAAHFDHDENVIEIVEEAQFMGRRLTFVGRRDGMIEIAFSGSPDETSKERMASQLPQTQSSDLSDQDRPATEEAALNTPYPDNEGWDATLPGEYDPDNGWDDGD